MKSTIRINSDVNKKIRDIFPMGLIPNNSNIDKSITGNGLTTAEIKAKRHSIIINPQVNTIKSKTSEWIEKHFNVFAIYYEEGDDIIEFLKSSKADKKIFITPESFPTLISKADEAGLLNMLYEEFFCLVDESHCFASEKFRKMILNPIHYVFKFKKIAFGSATPYPYTDPRVIALQKYKIIYKGKRGLVNVVQAKSPRKAIAHLIKQNNFKGNVHIFFNSVTEIAKLVRNTGITDVNIYCADEEINHTKLFDVDKYFKSEPKEGEYARFNFYTCRYIEGWDLFDTRDATIIIVTDTGVPHSLISIPIKAVQCIGRLRDVTPHEIIHITNHFDGKVSKQTLAQVNNTIMLQALHIVELYKSHRNFTVQNGISEINLMDDLIAKYSCKILGVPEIDNFKVDQHVYEGWCKCNYSSIETVIGLWHEANYDTKPFKFDLDEKEPYDISNKKINRTIIEKMIEYRTNPETYRYGPAQQMIKRWEDKYPSIIEAILLLGIERIKQLNYDDKLMKKERIDLNNKNALAAITIDLDKILAVNGKYLKATLKEMLQQLYDKHKYLDSSGKVMKAKANQIETELKLYKIKDDRISDGNGKRQAGFKILEKYFDLREAA